ncbi:MAG: GerAB/ArcD/ProY family transporter [Bacillota bacterium]
MGDRVKFGMAEAVVMLTMSAMARIFLPFPRSLVDVSGPAAWLSGVAGLAFALLQAAIFYYALKPHPQKDILDVTREALGKFAGTAANLIYAFYFLMVVASFVRNFSETLLVSALPRTPISVVSISYILMAMFGSYIGLEAMARAARITYPFVVGGIGILLLGLYPRWDYTNLFPILGNGPVEVFITGGFFSGMVSEILLAAVIVRSFHNWGDFGLIVSRAMLMGFGYLTLLLAVYILTVSYNAAQELTLPFYSLSRLIYLGRFFQRVEAIFIVIWGFIAILKISLTLFASAYVLARTFRLPDYRPLTWPLAVIVFSVGFIPPDLPSSLTADKYLRTWAVLPTVIIPIAVLVAARFRMRGRPGEGG